MVIATPHLRLKQAAGKLQWRAGTVIGLPAFRYMPRPLPKVPEFEVSPVLADHPYYAPALELVRRVRQKSELNDDEILILA